MQSLFTEIIYSILSITLTGSGKELLSNDAVRAAYLGA